MSHPTWPDPGGAEKRTPAAALRYIGAVDAAGITLCVEKLREAFRSGRTRPQEWRREQLGRLRDLLVEREDELCAALHADLGKPEIESYLSEIGLALREAKRARRLLGRWMKPERVPPNLGNFPARCRVLREPFGVALIMGPWNYPVNLVLAPLIGALAAGNSALLKPSEAAARTAECLARLLPEYLDPDAVAVIQGGADTAALLLEERFDLIFFTGGPTVGRIVMQAAARHLTPVILELGGKCPCIVDRRADVRVAARRIAWGKFLNAGQSCVAPDHVLVHASREGELLAELSAAVRSFYGADPRQSADYGRIVHEGALRRLVELLAGGTPVIGGSWDAASRYFAPTILTGVARDSRLMREEIFGPILPVLPVNDLDEAIALVNGRERPLALYLFSQERRSAERLAAETSSGALCVNEAVTHFSVPGLPFGGVGESGLGAYHGRHSFEAFSHRKAFLARGTRLDPALRYPPWDEQKARWLRRLI